ncbi:MAG: DUF4123 domain-containing protein [Proteobacteria bacterium]|nr:DUF4123 domain-containing protein [Pseudomonadota bacterium]
MSEQDETRSEQAEERSLQALPEKTQGEGGKYPARLWLRERLLDRARAEGGALYAILDAARNVEVLSGVVRFEQIGHSLYRGLPEEPLSDVAPYLVRLDDNGEMLEWLLDRGWGLAWSVFLVARANPEDLRGHFARLVTVMDEEGTEMYFRFYDPRVLRVFLPTCTASELDRLFGPASSFLVESDRGSELLAWSRAEKGLRLESCALESTGEDILIDLVADEETGEDQHGPLVIHSAQLDAFYDHSRSNYEGRLAAEFQAVQAQRPCDLPDLAGEALLERIHGAVDKALEYGVDEEDDLTAFVDITFRLGEDFDQDPKHDWAVKILQDPGLEGHAKVERIRRNLDVG